METSKTKNLLLKDAKQHAGLKMMLMCIGIVLVSFLIFTITGISTKSFSTHEFRAIFVWVLGIEILFIPITYMVGRRVKRFQVTYIKDVLDSCEHMIRYYTKSADAHIAEMEEIDLDFTEKMLNIVNDAESSAKDLREKADDIFSAKLKQIAAIYESSSYSDDDSDVRDINLAFAEYEHKLNGVMAEVLDVSTTLDINESIKERSDKIKAYIKSYKEKNQAHINDLLLEAKEAGSVLVKISR